MGEDPRAQILFTLKLVGGENDKRGEERVHISTMAPLFHLQFSSMHKHTHETRKIALFLSLQ